MAGGRLDGEAEGLEPADELVDVRPFAECDRGRARTPIVSTTVFVPRAIRDGTTASSSLERGASKADSRST